MMDTVCPGDVVVLRAFDTPPTLEVLENETRKAPMNRVRAEVPHDAIEVLNVNDEAPTLKRIRYQHGSNGDWAMLIVADNPDTTGHPYTERTDDTVGFCALLMGIAEAQKDWRE